MATIDDVRQIYANILQRSGAEVTAAEINSYVAAIDSGALTLAQARSALINSTEGQDVQDVVRLYQTVFGRVPDQAGLNNQVDTLRGPATEADLANSFAASPEFTTRFGGNTVNSAFINSVYQQVLGRTPSAGEVDFYLNSGFSAGRIALAFSEAPEFRANANGPVVAFLDAAGQGTAVFSGPLGGTGGIPTNPGVSFSLTAGVDSIGPSGTTLNNGEVTAAAAGAGNDTITAVLGTTLTVADSVNLGGGVNTANLTNVGNLAVGAANTPTLTNVQVINYRDTATANSFDAALTPQLTTFNINGSLVGTTLNNVKAQTNVFGIANTTADDAADFAVNYTGAQLTGTTDAVTLNVANIGTTATTAGNFGTVAFAADAAGRGVEVVNLNSTGTVRLDAVTSTDGAASTLTNLNVTGAGSVRIDTALDFAGTGAVTGTVDASKASGAVQVTLGAAENVTFTGGSGNDRVNAVATLTSQDILNGGGGVNTISQDLIASVATANYANVTNFQTLAITGEATGAIDTSLVPDSITTFSLEGGVNALFSGATKLVSGDTVTFNNINNTVTAATFALAAPNGTADVLNLKVTDLAADKAFTSLTATGFETINLDVRTGTNTVANTLTLTKVVDANLQTLRITGDEAVTLGGAAWTTGNLTSLDASGVTKAVTVLGDVQFNNAGASLVTGSGNDNITFNVALNPTLAVNAGSQVANGGTDVLTLTGAQVGTTAIDLSAADQITQVNGSANAIVQTGFESVNAAAITGAGQITIVGTTGSDNITLSTAGTGATTTTGGDGVDFINVSDGAGAGNVSIDTIVVNATTAANADLITGFVGGAGGDIFRFTGGLVNGTSTSADGIAAGEISSANTFALGIAGNAQAIVYIDNNGITGAEGLTAIGTLATSTTPAAFAANSAALSATLVGTGGALTGTIAGLDAALGVTESALLVLGGAAGDTNAVVVRITNTSTTVADTLTADEVQVVGVFNDVNTAILAANNFTYTL